MSNGGVRSLVLVVPSMDADHKPGVFIAVSRTKALIRGVLWSTVAMLAALATYAVFVRLRFVPSGISNRLVDYSLAIIALPLPIAGIIALFRALRWIALSLWRGIGIQADPSGLVFSLGPFGKRSFVSDRMLVRYPFETLDDPEAGAGVEAYLPEEEQVRTLLPRMTYPGCAQQLGDVMLKFAAGDQDEIAAKLAPIALAWRQKTKASDTSTD